MGNNGSVLSMICKCSTKSDHFEICVDTDKSKKAVSHV
jgi:hypothetical protein